MLWKSFVRLEGDEDAYVDAITGLVVETPLDVLIREEEEQEKEQEKELKKQVIYYVFAPIFTRTEKKVFEAMLDIDVCRIDYARIAERAGISPANARFYFSRVVQKITSNPRLKMLCHQIIQELTADPAKSLKSLFADDDEKEQG